MDEKHPTNFYEICICILEFLAIFTDFLQIFPARKTIYLNICGIYLLFGAPSGPVGIFSVFFRIFLEFFGIF